MLNIRQLLVFDMDDTLTETQKHIHEVMIKYFIENKKWDELEEYKSLISKDIKSLDFPKYYSDLIWDVVIKNPIYMLEVKPTNLANKFFSKLDTEVYEIAICTHRGWSDKGLENTEIWLNENYPNVNVSDIHCIKSKEYPNKLEYLESIYGDREFLLIDDNPLHDRSVIHEFDKRLLVYQEYNNFKAYSLQNTISKENNWCGL